ncbi:MAG: hypothetical protein ABR582_05540 [Gemmatimonadaceae bacterium]
MSSHRAARVLPDSRNSVLWPNHVTRRPDETGVAHVARGLSTGSGECGRLFLPPNMGSVMSANEFASIRGCPPLLF